MTELVDELVVAHENSRLEEIFHLTNQIVATRRIETSTEAWRSLPVGQGYARVAVVNGALGRYFRDEHGSVFTWDMAGDGTPVECGLADDVRSVAFTVIANEKETVIDKELVEEAARLVEGRRDATGTPFPLDARGAEALLCAIADEETKRKAEDRW
ncbi:hypothetical protein [Aeromicrobium sp. 179-A 4D2 NHS]|uniref:hypothetical protein n=1 Tax=Aeromicrobium sp. 179-A 4D2 NHS TaxID=3142375 RepID=UPI0039A11328